MFSKLQRNQKGFTLIELMIVVVIIGILAALAIPRFMAATGKAKKSEAKSVLKQIYVLERAYYQEYDAYISFADDADCEALGFQQPVEAKSRYNYNVVALAGPPATFTATATEETDADGDAIVGETLTMDQDMAIGGTDTW